MAKTRYFIIVCFFWLLGEDTYAHTGIAGKYADKAFYLIDSMVLADFSQSDKIMIDSMLELYHAATHDTTKLNYLDYIIEECYDDAVWPKYNRWMHNKVQKLLSSTSLTESVKGSYLITLATAMNNFGYGNMNRGEFQQALEYYNKSLKIRMELRNSSDSNIMKKGTKGIATTLNNIGYIYRRQGDIPKAMEYYNKSLSLLEDLGNKVGVAGSLNNIASLYKEVGDILKSLEYNHRSLKIYEKLDHKEGIGTCLNNIAGIYKRQGDIPKALEYYHISLNVYREMDYKVGMAYALNNLGSIYDDKGDEFKALEYFRKGLKLNEESGYTSGIAFSLNNIATIKAEQGDIKGALKVYHKCLKMSEDMGDKKGITFTLHKLGVIEMNQGELDLALKYGMRGLDIAKELGSPEQISSSSNLLFKVAKKQANLITDVYLQRKKYKDALAMYELFILMRDSVKNEDTQKATIRQQTKYEFEKAQLVNEQEQKEIRRKTKEKRQRRDNLQYSVILIGILILFGGILSLGFINVSERMAEGIIFFSFLILFEFLLVLADPYIDNWSGGAPGIKLLFNAGIAALIFPLHSFFETRLKGRLEKS